MPRKKTLLASSLVLAVLLIPLGEGPALVTEPYVQAVTENSAIVAVWLGDAEPCGIRVRSFGDDAGPWVHEADAPANAHHEFRITGLQPATRYAYELRRALDDWEAGGSFNTQTTDDRAPTHFAMLGDSGGQPWWVDLQTAPLFQLTGASSWLPIEDEPRAVATVLAALDPSFCLHMGDVIYPAGEHRHYGTGLYGPFGDWMRDHAFYPVLGNHDVKAGNGAPFVEHFALPVEPGESERNFTFRAGPVRFVGLDLNERVDADHEALAFLRRVAAESSEPWLVVYSHFPVQSAYRKEPRADLETHYLPLCRELCVDLVCAGHDHNYQRFGGPDDTIQIVTGGGGKSLYEIRSEPEGLVVAESAYHVCDVTVHGPTLRLQAHAVDGSILDTFEIDRRVALEKGRLEGDRERRARALLD
ncbi:MAG: metallophosphoesterase [Planctomycetota bacterium]|nr:metallophosphoesterase [Planctomycetota bacterium]